jgi:hypothetical protein
MSIKAVIIASAARSAPPPPLRRASRCLDDPAPPLTWRNVPQEVGARVLNTCLAFGIAVLVIAYALGIHNITAQYTAILGGALLCFVAALAILMWHLAKRAPDSSRPLPRATAWDVSILMGAVLDPRGC